MPTKLFLIDDHQMLRDGVRLLFRRSRDVKVVGDAATCAQALEGVRRLRPDVVLLDYRLPDGDGLKLLGQLRSEFPALKVLMMSGTLNRAIVRACMLAGANGFISKEVAAQDIATAVRTVVRGENYLSAQAVNLLVEILRPDEASGAALLTPQEIAVLRGIAAGLTYKEIALQLGISPKSVETYRARLVRKTGLRSKVALARFATANDLALP
jgi:DNA-binding NarL/FixJ family response regulator